MQRVKPTDKWNSPIAVVPGQRPVRYPATPPHIVAVNDPTAKYLIDRQMAVAVDGNNEETTPQRDSAEATETQSVGTESESETKDKSEAKEQSEVKDRSEALEQSEAAGEPDLEKAVEFIKSSTVKEISKVEMIGSATAKKLKAEDELTAATVREMLSDRQIESLLNHLENSNS